MLTQHVKNFEVIERLDAGGMAEVFRGKQLSAEGFEKQVALKRILPSFAKNERFIGMFLDEARLSLRLNHANIVSVFDVSQTGGTWFIVMEYVDGLNLKKLIDGARQREGQVPVAIACYIVGRVCDALQYAHDRRDDAGRPLNIVHRDVSPPNVLVSWDGEVKLTDFGLAKAASQAELTDPGVVKGKFGYLSPEAALGETVDHRTDIFATGILLWEMLAGRRLFLGKTDLETLQAVRAAEIPSIRDINGRVSPALEQILRRALARDRNERFASAREFGMALAQNLVSSGLSVTAFDLATWVKETAASAPDTRGPSMSSFSTNLIQEEINRLIREQSSRSPGAAGGTEDPRNWLDDDEETGTTGAHYAARPGTSEQVVASPKIRTRSLRAVPTPAPTPSPIRPQPTHTPAPVATEPVRTAAPAVAASSSVEPAPPAAAPAHAEPQPAESRPASRGTLVLAAIAVVVIVLAAVLIYLVART